MPDPLKYFVEPPVRPIAGNAHRRRQAALAAAVIFGLLALLLAGTLLRLVWR